MGGQVSKLIPVEGTGTLRYDLGAFNWCKRFKFLNPFFQHLSVRRVEKLLKTKGTKYTKEKKDGKTIISIDVA